MLGQNLKNLNFLKTKTYLTIKLIQIEKNINC